MSRMILNDRGISIVESLIAVMLTGLAVIGLLTMAPLGMQSAGKADSISHGTQIMQRELEDVESRIMAGNFSALSDLTKTNVVEIVDKERFTINVAVTEPSTNRWLVRVRVTWPSSTKGVRSSILVTRQSAFD